MDIKIIKECIYVAELQRIAKEGFGDMVKVVVDIEQGIMAVGGGLHADEELLLVEEEGSKREHTWGINLYPYKTDSDFVEFNSLINLKPTFGNHTRNVDNADIRARIIEIVRVLVKP